MDWKIYYGDGSTFSSEDGEPHEAPPHDVMVISQKDDNLGCAVYNKWDWYFYTDENGGWYGADIFGVMDQMMHNCEKIKGVIQGRVTTDEKFYEILRTARTDPDLPVKSANSKSETRGKKYGDGLNK